jgi:hypothetical protein
MHDMILIDNQRGINLNANGETNEQAVIANNMKIFGESPADDCPSTEECYCPNKMGFMLFGSHQGGRGLHPLKKSSLPVFKIKSYATFDSTVEVSNMEFSDFESQTRCGKKQVIFARNPSAADRIPLHNFNGITFNNVAEDALAYIEDPSPGWANPTDCGDWPCTAPENVVLKFNGVTYPSNIDLPEDEVFQIVSNNKPAANKFDE